MPAYSRRVEVPGKSSEELYQVVSSDIDRMLAKSSIGNFKIDRDPVRKEVRVSSSMFSATLLCQNGVLSLDGKLSLLAAPFRSKIDEGIDRWLQRHFQGIKKA
ncbi:MAG: hypothetical protein A2X94_16920 [Bdellovibrionales bacterium GWB1_55_8]|nr:MAG: hypothetical protein A2X94_16920 [Bdellovibrionales bacterium GWB1_55_8]